MKHYIFCLVGLFIIASCQNPKELTPDRYLRWVSSEDHGFIHTKEVEQVTLQARFLPADYQAYREYARAGNTLSFDSILLSYGCGLTFQLSIWADKENEVYRNLLYYDTRDQDESLARIRYLNFRIEEFITLQHGSESYKPVLSHFEGYDEFGNKMNFQISFIVPQYSCEKNPSSSLEDVILTFDDPFWDLGINHFLFDKDLFINSPRLKH